MKTESMAIAAPPSKANVSLGAATACGWSLLKQDPKGVAIYVFAAMLQVAIAPVALPLFGVLTNRMQATPGKDSGTIGLYVLWAALLLGTVGISMSVKYALALLDSSMANRLRDQLFRVILRQGPAFFHNNDSGSLTMTATQMTVETQMALRQMLVDPVVQAVSLIATMIALYFSFSHLKPGHGGWVLALISAVLLLAILLLWAMKKMGRALQATSLTVRDQALALNGYVNGAFGSPEEIQAFEAEDAFAEKHRGALETFRKSRMRQTLAMEFINSSNSLPGIIIEIVFLGVILSQAMSGKLDRSEIGYIFPIVLLAPNMMLPIQAISIYAVMINNSWPSVEKILGLLRSGNDGAPGSTKSAAGRAPADLSFGAKDLVFRYGPDLPPVFSGVTADFPQGKITGFVAESGQGKTTFFRLALRFYDPQQGHVIVGGAPAIEVSPTVLRSKIALMSQFPAFFHDTVRENFKLANSAATDQEIRVACESTGLWPILEQLAQSGANGKGAGDPLDYPFAAGQLLSGGQRKLFALTRCLLRSPTHLLLDEPTAGMDVEKEFSLVPLLRKACAGRTAVVVSHDIPWLRLFCDYFIVLDRGRIVQRGTGNELANQPGKFKELLEKFQLGGSDNGGSGGAVTQPKGSLVAVGAAQAQSARSAAPAV
ncbi:MAG TPA: ABC transporter ATP-binding protein [Candidatus Baltobacteraceae bacterium]|nr:ABC transporter ATP-binding protein [Candidatus Baltobacteraceae bacterium]